MITLWKFKQKKLPVCHVKMEFFFSYFFFVRFLPSQLITAAGIS